MKPFLLWGSILLLCCTACHRDIFQDSQIESSLETGVTHKFSQFVVQKKLLEIGDCKAFTIRLKNIENHELLSFEAEAEKIAADKIRVCISIPRNRQIANGHYHLLAQQNDSTNLCPRVKVQFQNERLCAAAQDRVSYPLPGNGLSADDPYLITDQSSFELFLSTLASDTEGHAFGYYFRQLTDINFDILSHEAKRKHFSPQPFAGCYMGANSSSRSKLFLNYTGAQKPNTDDQIGLFSTLLNGAVVKDLNLNVNFMRVNSFGGAVAGKVSGAATLSNLYVSGSILESNDHIGGLVGQVELNAKLNVERCYLSASLSSRQYLGGVAGSSYGDLSVNGFGNVREGDKAYGMISLSAYQGYVGGVAGLADGKNFTIKNVTLKNDIEYEDMGIDIIHSSQGNYLGGLIGRFNSRGPALFESCSVYAPISGSDRTRYVGGLVGYCAATGSASDEFVLNSVHYGSALLGYQYVGGFFGMLDLGARCLSFPKSSKSSSVKKANGFCQIKSYQDYCGGLMGYLRTDGGGTLSIADNLLVAGTIEGGNAVGGLFGYVYNFTLNTSTIQLDANSVVNGTLNVGGLIGMANSCRLTGRSTGTSIALESFSHKRSDMVNSLPNPDFAAWVNKDKQSTASIVGGIVGCAKNSTLKNYAVSGTVFGSHHVGGLVGVVDYQNTGNEVVVMESCYNISEAGVKCSQTAKTAYAYETSEASSASVGGIAALCLAGNISFKQVYNYANIESPTPIAGGIVSFLEGQKDRSVKFSYCFNFGNITAKQSDTKWLKVGGILGGCLNASYQTTVSDCYNGGNHTAECSSETNCVGGIVGQTIESSILIERCANSGSHSITGSSGSCYLGGILGRSTRKSVISECSNSGRLSIEKKGSSHVGGIQGDLDQGEIKNCYNNGEIASKQDADNGGIVGCVDGGSNVNHCCNLGKVQKGNHIFGTHDDWLDSWDYNSVYGVGSDKAKNWKNSFIDWKDRKNKDKYKGFDFNSTWTTRSDESYNNGAPILRNNHYQFLTYTAN